MGVFDFFPYENYRPHQKETIARIVEAFEKSDYVILESPTGSGKSAIAITLALFYNSSYILTSQKILQDQYVRDFSSDYRIKVLKGRSNYLCVNLGKGAPCSKGPCIVLEKCDRKSECHYFNAKFAALAAPVALMNYSYFLRAPGFSQRKLLICDETHQAEQSLMSKIEFRLSEFRLKKLGVFDSIPIFDDVKDYYHWLIDIKNLTSNKIEWSAEHLNDNNEWSEIQKRVEEHNELVELEKGIDFFLNTCNNTEWIFDILESKELQRKTIVFKPLTIEAFSHGHLLDFGEKKLLMSATILDVDSFIRTLGIEKEVKFIQIDSTFPVENRKVYVTNSGKMSYGSIDKTLPKIVEDIKKILDFHEDEKGIIHTHSYKISKYIQDNIDDKRLYFHDSGSRSDVLQQHISSKDPTVLVSPSMKEGIDLYDELARFCVIVKLPYPSLGDKQTKKRMEKDSRWYQWQTALAIVQAAGRGIRHEEDYCTIYIMDSGIKYFIHQNESMFPKYFLKSIMN